MSDVTRWRVIRDCLSDESGRTALPICVIVITEADHLAALERVRVETHNKAIGQVGLLIDNLHTYWTADGPDHACPSQQEHDWLLSLRAKVDSLIEATTTPLEES